MIMRRIIIQRSQSIEEYDNADSYEYVKRIKGRYTVGIIHTSPLASGITRPNLEEAWRVS